jgi:hypothetical protein
VKRISELWAKSREHLTAIATIIVVPFVIAGAIIAYLAFRDQAVHDSKEEAAKNTAAIRAQAEQVSAATIAGEGGFPMSGSVTRVALYNRSIAPVYKVVVTLVLVQGAGPRYATEMTRPDLRREFQRYYTSLVPGKYEAQVSAGWGGMMARPGIEIAFTDSNGRSWARYANGKLVRLPQPPEAYYRLEEPVNWVSPKALP